jgi:hypothetical protein
MKTLESYRLSPNHISTAISFGALRKFSGIQLTAIRENDLKSWPCHRQFLFSLAFMWAELGYACIKTETLSLLTLPGAV